METVWGGAGSKILHRRKPKFINPNSARGVLGKLKYDVYDIIDL